MLKRTITGAGLVALVVGFFFLRNIDVRLFDIFIALLAVLGTFEIARAFNQKSPLFGEEKKQNFVVLLLGLLFSALIVPIYLLVGTFYLLVLYFISLLVFVFLSLVLKGGSLKGFLRTALCITYPNLLILFILLINHLNENSFIALVLVFIVAPATDVFAYLVGSLIGGKKLCPKISPKKTISGAVGGLLGGVASCIIVYFILNPVLISVNPILFFVILGIIASICTQIGDLFESYIKRKLDIKDMGKLLPGHGGVLDRIDGIIFSSFVIYIAFLLV